MSILYIKKKHTEQVACTVLGFLFHGEQKCSIYIKHKHLLGQLGIAV